MKRSGGVLAAALAVLVYVNALDNPFVYDDQVTVVDNPSLVDLSNIRFVLTHSPFRPVVNVSYALDRAVWGADPFGFHLTNVILHGLVVLLFFVLLRTACADARGRMASGLSRPMASDGWVAFAAAALFGVHPLLAEAVGYVSGRSELLCGLFFLAALLCARAAIVRSHAMWIGAAILALLALLSKEVALALPVVVLAYDWLVLPGDAAGRRRRAWLIFLPSGVALGLAAIYRVSVAAGPISAEAPLLNLWTQAIVIWRYLALLVIPVGQSIMHNVHIVTSPSDLRALLAVAGLVVLIVAAVILRRGVPLVSFGIVWFLAVIAPSSSVVALREGMAEHRAYLASAGVFMAMAGAVASGRILRIERSPRFAHTAIFGAACVLLASLTLARNQVWGSPVRLWGEATVRAAGMWEPHYALADVLRESGDCGRAVVEYETVVRMRPHHRDAYTNMGICLAQTNRLIEAERALRRALDIDPAFARGYTNLGAVALMSGQADRARNFYQQAIEVDAGNVLARMQLARLYETVYNDFHAAVRMCGEARALAPFTPGVIDCVERNQRLAAGKDAGR